MDNERGTSALLPDRRVSRLVQVLQYMFAEKHVPLFPSVSFEKGVAAAQQHVQWRLATEQKAENKTNASSYIYIFFCLSPIFHQNLYTLLKRNRVPRVPQVPNE
jgi:hypothetical protein